MAKYIVTARVACIIDADCEDSARDYWEDIAREIADSYEIIFDLNEVTAKELFD